MHAPFGTIRCDFSTNMLSLLCIAFQHAPLHTPAAISAHTFPSFATHYIWYMLLWLPLLTATSSLTMKKPAGGEGRGGDLHGD